MLPYKTLQEAESAMGRSLTTAETLWFKYTVNKSDYFLYCHNVLFLFVVFFITPLFYIFIELIYKNIHRYKIQPKVKLSYSQTLKCYLDVTRLFVLVIAPHQILSCPSVKTYGIRTSLPLPSLSEIVAQLLVYFIVEDYTNYWIHRFFHTKWGYEKIHKVHHEYTAPTAFSASYAHWAEVLILGIPGALGPAMVPGHMITFWLWITLRQMESVENHSGYDIPWAITNYIPFYGGADFHDYHHYVGARSQSNFAPVFTYCDYIYGTDKGYRYQKKLIQQLKDGSESNGKQNGGSHISAEDYKSD